MEVRGSIYHYPISPRAASQVAASLVEPSDGSLFRHPTPWIPHASSGFVCGFDECRFASAYKIYGILSTLNPLCSLVVWDSRSSFSVIQLVIWVLLVDFCRGYAAHVRTPTLPPISGASGDSSDSGVSGRGARTARCRRSTWYACALNWAS